VRRHDVNWYLRDQNWGVLGGRNEVYLNHRLFQRLLNGRIGVDDTFCGSAHR
jgi:hypothetical protein